MIRIVSTNAEANLEEFHHHLAAHGNLNDVMIGRYIDTVREFASWYESYSGESFHARSISPKILNPYRSALSERGISAKDIKQHILILGKLFEWAANVQE